MSPLNGIDTYLRTNIPWLWATKIHEHIYITLAVTALISLIVALVPIDPANLEYGKDAEVLFAWMMIPAVGLAIFYIVRMALFSVHKRFGKYFFYMEFFEFMVYFIAITLPFIIPYSVASVSDYKASLLYSEAEVEEMNKQFEIGQFYFPTSESDYDYFESQEQYRNFLSATMKDGKNLTKEEKDALYFYNYSSDEITSDIYYHKGNYSERRPRLYFHIPYDSYKDFKQQETMLLRDNKRVRDKIDFYEAIININLEHSLSDAKQHIEKTIKIISQFSQLDTLQADIVLRNFINNRYNTNEDYGYYYYYDEDNITIGSAKYRTERNLSYLEDSHDWDRAYLKIEVIYVFLTILFAFALLFFIFKNNSWQKMLLGFCVQPVLSIIIGILTLVFDGDEEFFLAATMVTTSLIILSSAFILTASKYSVWHSLVAVFTNMALPYYLLILFGFLDEFNILDVGDFVGSIVAKHDEYFRDDEGMLYLLGAGMVLYIFIGNSYMKAIYRKILFLPRTS